MNFDNPFSRITLDSTKDWDRIKDNITRTLLQAIDQRCAEGNLDPALKEEVTQRTLEWRDQLFALSIPNLRLDGQPFDEFLKRPQPTEEFDESLDRKIRSLAAEKELVQVQIAERRSKTPGDIHHLVKDLVRRKVASEWMPQEDGEEEMEVEIEPLPNKESMVQSLSETLSAISNLTKILPTQLERANQACEVAEEVSNLPP
ncbi:hypothetical protein BDY24DRAFT_381017 [Mrakia frigida]|uniref:uncharacterized protein n=1 Tax=Mrakia frigida TaxID=29902 RepID=UPI003FCC0458